MVDRLSHALTPRILASGPHTGRRITTQAPVTASIFSLTHVHLVTASILSWPSSTRVMPFSSESILSKLPGAVRRLASAGSEDMVVPPLPPRSRRARCNVEYF